MVDSTTDFKGSHCAVLRSDSVNMQCDLRNLYVGLHSAFCKMRGNLKDTYYGLQYGSNKLYDTVFEGNYICDIFRTGNNIGYRCSFNSPTPFVYDVESTMVDDNMLHVFYDVGRNYGHLLAQSGGGTLTTNTTPIPSLGLDYTYYMSGASSNWYNWVDIPVLMTAGQKFRIQIYVQCDSLPSTFVEEPKFKILRNMFAIGDPNAILVEKSALTDGGDNTTWNTFILEYTPTSNEQAVLRATMKDPSKTFSWGYKILSTASAVLQFRGV
jgi:hypothetical protein